MTATPITVRPYEVEEGDVLLGLTTPVALPILCDDRGVWWYRGAGGQYIARRPAWGLVQIVRAQGVVEGPGRESLAGRSDSPSTATSPGERPGGVAGGVDASSGASPASRDWCDPRGIERSHGLWVVTP